MAQARLLHVQARLLHVSVAVPPVPAIGVRIAGSEVLTICVRIVLRATAGVRDNLLRHGGSCETCPSSHSGGAAQSEIHPGLPGKLTVFGEVADWHVR